MTPGSDNPIRVGVLLSGGGRTLMNILDEIEAGRLNATVATVIVSRECKGIERCRDRGLNVHMVAYKSMPSDQAYSDAITALLDAADVNLVILAGFLSPYLVPAPYAGKVMNIHPALLPKFGGKGMYGHYVHEAVIAAGEAESGCTVHFVTNDYDKGPIILQKHVPVLPGDTPDDLADRVFEQECLAYPQAIRLFAEGRLSVQNGRVVTRD